MQVLQALLAKRLASLKLFDLQKIAIISA